MGKKKGLLAKIEKSLRKRTRLKTSALFPRQKTIKRVNVQKPQGFFKFD